MHRVVIWRLLICCMTVNIVLRCETNLSHFERKYLYPTDSNTVSGTAKFRNSVLNDSCTCMARWYVTVQAVLLCFDTACWVTGVAVVNSPQEMEEEMECVSWFPGSRGQEPLRRRRRWICWCFSNWWSRDVVVWLGLSRASTTAWPPSRPVVAVSFSSRSLSITTCVSWHTCRPRRCSVASTQPGECQLSCCQSGDRCHAVSKVTGVMLSVSWQVSVSCCQSGYRCHAVSHMTGVLLSVTWQVSCCQSHDRCHMTGVVLSITWQVSRCQSHDKCHAVNHKTGVMLSVTWHVSCCQSHDRCHASHSKLLLLFSLFCLNILCFFLVVLLRLFPDHSVVNLSLYRVGSIWQCCCVVDVHWRPTYSRELQTLLDRRGYSIVMTEEELNGPERFAADNILTEAQCQRLMKLANVSSVTNIYLSDIV